MFQTASNGITIVSIFMYVCMYMKNIFEETYLKQRCTKGQRTHNDFIMNFILTRIEQNIACKRKFTAARMFAHAPRSHPPLCSNLDNVNFLSIRSMKIMPRRKHYSELSYLKDAKSLLYKCIVDRMYICRNYILKNCWRIFFHKCV